MKRRNILAFYLALILVLVGLAPSVRAVDEFSDVVVFATKKIEIKENVIGVNGDFIVNNNGGELKIEKDVAISGNLKGDKIEIKEDTTVNGNVFSNDLKNEGTIVGGTFPLPLPVFTSLPPIEAIDRDANAPDINVAKFGSALLAEGDYDEILAKEGAAITFSGGTYQIRTLKAEDDCVINFEGATTLVIEEKLEIKKNCYFGPAPAANLSAAGILVYLPDGGQEAKFDENNEIRANIYVFDGKVTLKKNSHAKGSFIAKEITIEENVLLELDSAFLQRAPVAVDDLFLVAQGGTLNTSASVLDNDSDPNPSDTISLTLFSPLDPNAPRPSFGTLVLNPDGTFSYTHDGGDSTEDSFEYQICDDGDPILCSTGTVNIVVNNAPTANPQDVFTSGTVPLNITLTGSDPDGEELIFMVVSSPLKGALSGLTQNSPSSATVIYTANLAGDLEDSFIFRATDPNGGFDDAVVSINPFDAGIEPPEPTNTVIAKDGIFELVEGASKNIALAGFADVADPAPIVLEFTISSPPTSGALGTLAGNIVSYTAATAGDDSFQFQVCGDLSVPLDGDTSDPGECDTGTINLVVSSFTPPPPPIPPTAENQTVMTPEDTSVEINLSDQTDSCAQGDTSCTLDPRSRESTQVGHRVLLPSGPNLTITSFSAPSCALEGETIGAAIQVTLTNAGPGDIPASTLSSIGFYLSTDSSITTSDTLLVGGRENLATSAPGGLLVGESISDFLFTGASIPTGGATSNLFIGVLADESDTVDEANEGDNTFAQAIEIKTSTETCASSPEPDLIVSSLIHSPLEPIGFGSVEFSAEVKNNGDADAAASTLCFAIDALDEDCSSTAALFPVPLLTPGATHIVDRTEDIAVGSDYQNTAVADIDGVVVESDEQNNSAVDTFGVGSPATLLTATVKVLPTKGTLFGIPTNSENGALEAITSVPTDLTISSVVYTPDPLPVGVSEITDFFSYSLFDNSTGLTSAQARVDLSIIEVIDTCLENGREINCSPGQ